MKAIKGLTIALILTVPLLTVARAGLLVHIHQPAQVTKVEQKRHRVAPVADCRWEQMSNQERAAVWSQMSVRHRDFHWRFLSKEDRRELRSLLTQRERKELRERFIARRGEPTDPPFVFYKRLPPQELQLLRRQIQEARARQLETQKPTPAQRERDMSFFDAQTRISEHHHQMLIITVQEKSSGVGDKSAMLEPSTDAHRLPVH